MLEEFFEDISGKIAYTGAAATLISYVASIYSYRQLKREWKNVPMKLVRTRSIRPNHLPHELHIDRLDESTKERVLEFQQTLESIPHINKDSFYRNMRGIRIKIYNRAFLRQILTLSRGYYEPIENKLTLLNNKKSALFHELFHLSSTADIDSNRYVAGFQTTYLDNGYEKGRGIDEGYTELLRDRYFKGKNVSYPDLVLICTLLELIAGQEVMEEFYFENNLKGLGESIDNFLGVSYNNPEEDPFALLISRIDFYFAIRYSCPFIANPFTIKDFKNIIFDILMMLALGVQRSLYIGNVEKAEQLLNAIHAATPLLTKKKKEELKMFLIKIQDEIKDFSTIGDVSKCIEGTPKIMTIKNIRASIQNYGGKLKC